MKMFFSTAVFWIIWDVYYGAKVWISLGLRLDQVSLLLVKYLNFNGTGNKFVNLNMGYNS
jgi:hypothetical protein